MTNIYVEYQIDEKRIAAKMTDYIESYIHDTLCNELIYMDIDVDHVEDSSFSRIILEVTREVCELLMEGDD